MTAALTGVAGRVDAQGAFYGPGPGPRAYGGPGLRPFGQPLGRPFGPPGLRPFGPPGGGLLGRPRFGGRGFGVPGGRVCFNPEETREKIVTHGLTEPFRALRMGGLQGEALRARLCRWRPGEFVYEVAVLRPDGRIVHVFMNAQNGKSVGNEGDDNR